MLDSFRRFGWTSPNPMFPRNVVTYAPNRRTLTPQSAVLLTLTVMKSSNYYRSFETGCSEVLTLYRTTIIQTDVT